LLDSADGSRQQSKELRVSLVSSILVNRGFWQAEQNHSYRMGLQLKAQAALLLLLSEILNEYSSKQVIKPERTFDIPIPW